MISADNKIRILSVLSIFETGDRDGNYGDVTVLKDGTDTVTNERILQITYGRHQTTEGSFLKELLTNYVDNKGQFADDIRPFIPKIGNGALAKNETFLDLLRKAGKDPIMHDTQDTLFDEKYYQPAFAFFTVNGFTLPLSMLVIYDSQIHSGGHWEDGILKSLRKRFDEVPPRKGGLEKAWIKAYVRVRHEWLSTHSDPILRKTNYRTKAFLNEIERDDNWDLSKPIKTQDVTSRSMPPR